LLSIVVFHKKFVDKAPFSKVKQQDRTESQGQINAKDCDGKNIVEFPLKRFSILFFRAVTLCYSVSQNSEPEKE